MTQPWRPVRAGRLPGLSPWLHDLEPLTTGLLAQDGLKLWEVEGRALLGIRGGGVVYPVLPQGGHPDLAAGAREVLGRLGESWCLMGPAPWVAVCEDWMPPSRVSHRVAYDFLVRPAGGPEVPGGPGELRPAASGDADALFALQEAYEKEEVLFDPAEFQSLVSRLHFWKTLRRQEVAALWEAGRPLAKAGTNALTAHWAQIGGVYTRPEYRGRGLQKRLMAFLLARLSAQGRGACLFVKKANLPAGRLYRSLGFQETCDFTIVYGQRLAWELGSR
jgi:ribosomal protein S18 acetylase RimI-like enzyme